MSLLPRALVLGWIAAAFASGSAVWPAEARDRRMCSSCSATTNARTRSTPWATGSSGAAHWTAWRARTVFTRAVSPNPLCITSRTEIMSGCCGIRNGRIGFGKLAPDHVPWTDVLRGGYHTWHVGKWHVPGRPTTRGYEEAWDCLPAAGPRSGRRFLRAP